ncbi:MAG: PH domain-containing protein [Phycisphaerae bacterium]|nr:PH domain-containing protein [Phycisphaerae bacterium]
MIHLTCDNCERALDVADELAGTKVKCPGCGDINVVPGVAPRANSGTPARAAPDRAQAAGHPPASGPEQRVLLVRPAMARARPFRFAALVLLLVGGLVGAGVASSRGMTALAALAGVVALAAVGVLLVWKVQKMSASLEITNKRTIERVGLLSKATTEVLHDDIKNFQVTQSFWQRLWRVGTIGISSSGQDGIEIVAADIPHPNRVREVIDLYRRL